MTAKDTKIIAAARAMAAVDGVDLDATDPDDKEYWLSLARTAAVALGKVFAPRQDTSLWSVTGQAIRCRACETAGCSVEEFVGFGRSRQAVRARTIATWAMRRAFVIGCAPSWPTITHALFGRPSSHASSIERFRQAMLSPDVMDAGDRIAGEFARWAGVGNIPPRERFIEHERRWSDRKAGA